MPLPSSRMTKQPARPTRYFPGKAYAEDPVSDDDDESEEEEEAPAQQPSKAAPPKFSSFPKQSLPVDVHKPSAPLPRAHSTKTDELDGFVTASESSDHESENGTSEGEEDSSEEEEEDSSSDDEPKKPMLAPRFISKAKRDQQAAAQPSISNEEEAEEEERKRKEKTDQLLQAQIERDTAARKAGRKYWDDEDAPVDDVVDTDGMDAEAEKAAWKLRELRRVQRDRQNLIAQEKERAEKERRQNLTAEEREKEDREYLEKQAEEREDKGKMAFMQKYHHKGAFFHGDEQDQEVKEALNRDVAGRRFVDEAGNKEVLPEYMRIRDSTKLGKKGRTKYKDLKSEDTGRWGRFEGRKRDHDGLDERFRPDDNQGGRDRTGANAAPVGERRRVEDDDRREPKRPRFD